MCGRLNNVSGRVRVDVEKKEIVNSAIIDFFSILTVARNHLLVLL